MTEAQGQASPEGQATQDEGQEQAQDRTFTQADLKKIAANEKREGKSAAEKAILERAGVESLDDIFSIVEAQKLVEAEMETAADKAEKAKTKAEERATAAEERYTNTLREFALRDSFRDAGINPERLKGAMRLADTSALEVDKDGNVSGLEEVIEAVKTEAPEFFQETRSRVNAPQTNGTGISRPNGQTPEEMQAQWLSQFIGR